MGALGKGPDMKGLKYGCGVRVATLGSRVSPQGGQVVYPREIWALRGSHEATRGMLGRWWDEIVEVWGQW